MKINFGRALLISTALSCISVGAYAAFGTGLNDTINERSDLTTFRSVAAHTRVVENLPTGTYTVFAPSDEAFTAVPAEKYPCLYSDQCVAEQAEILKNHIVQGEINLGDVTRGAGGVYAIDKRHITISEPTKGEFYVDGHKVISSNLTSSGMLYVIDGVIATPQELANLERLKTRVVVETKTEKTTVRTTTPHPDSHSTTTTKTTTTVRDAQ